MSNVTNWELRIKPMNNFTCKLVQNNDIEELVKVSIRSFHSDYLVGAPSKNGGPPGYDSIQFHNKILEKAEAFYKINENEKIIGGFWIFCKGNNHIELSRVFIDPDYQRQGIGLRVFDYLFSKYPNVQKWSLDTPKWNKRTFNFYTKLGFLVEREDNFFYYFAKTIT
jgi:ribosomal protein S18 acetylase RimI-like enzyme